MMNYHNHVKCHLAWDARNSSPRNTIFKKNVDPGAFINLTHLFIEISSSINQIIGDFLRCSTH
jgi:hypothetical protein